MLISKFDLYKNEWLDLVFSDRNKEYGAYELRQHNSRVMAQALLVMVSSIIVVAFVFDVILKQPIKPVVKITQVVDKPFVLPKPPVEPPKPVQPPHTLRPPAPPAAAAPTIRFVPPVVAPDPIAQNPPKIDAMAGKQIGPVTVQGTPGASPVVDQPATDESGGGGTDIVLPIGLQREPMPVGGFEAFNKFISKHLHFPPEAEEAHVGGRVFVSFIVEKDGSLSSFTILRGPGYGTNEEALRVLKLAPAWVPGLQNNHPVRVQYNIPINFQMADDGN